jgi:hypothetical protein
MAEEVTAYIHYHEYDFNKEHPTLVLRGTDDRVRRRDPWATTFLGGLR